MVKFRFQVDNIQEYTNTKSISEVSIALYYSYGYDSEKQTRIIMPSVIHNRI